jgi:hypothetical protein
MPERKLLLTVFVLFAALVATDTYRAHLCEQDDPILGRGEWVGLVFLDGECRYPELDRRALEDRMRELERELERYRARDAGPEEK